MTYIFQTLQSRLYDRDRQNWKWIVSDLDFRGPDYEPLDGFVGLTLPIPSWKTDSVDERQMFGRKIHSDVSSGYNTGSSISIPLPFTKLVLNLLIINHRFKLMATMKGINENEPCFFIYL